MAKANVATTGEAGFGSWVRIESQSAYVRAAVLAAVAQLINSTLAGILQQQTLTQAAWTAASAAFGSGTFSSAGKEV